MSNPFAVDFTAKPIPFGSMVHEQPGGKKSATSGRRAFLARTNRRRFARLKAAAEVLDVLPEEGETLYAIMTGYYDLMHLLIVLLQRVGSPCQTMRIATLSLSARNVQEMVALLDDGAVRSIDLLTSHFFAKHDEEIFSELAEEFHQRGQRIAAARSHCKIVTLALDDGRKYVLSGSPNLRTNKNQEQFALERNADLFAFYDTWIQTMVAAHEIGQKDCPGTS